MLTQFSDEENYRPHYGSKIHALTQNYLLQVWIRLKQSSSVYMHKYDPCVMWLFLFFLLSSVRQLWVTATSLWSSTAGVRTGRRSVLWSCSSSVTRLTCGKRCATFGTDSQRVRSTPWVRAPVQDSCCPTWASAAPPATWRLRPACLQFSAARAGLRVDRPGRSTGLSCFTKKSASAGRVIGRILFLSLSSKYLSLYSWLFRNGLNCQQMDDETVQVCFQISCSLFLRPWYTYCEVLFQSLLRVKNTFQILKQCCSVSEHPDCCRHCW